MRGGWCPPTAFAVSCMTAIAHDVSLPVLFAQSQPYVLEAADTSAIHGVILEVYTDGSHNPRIAGDHVGAGIAAGWIAGDDDATNRVSLAGVYAGAEISELLGIIGVLQYLYTKCMVDELPTYDTILLRIHSKNAEHPKP